MAKKNQSAPARTNARVNPRATARQAPASAPAPAPSMQITQPNGNPIVTQAPARPSHVQPSYVDAGSGQSFNTRFVPGAMQPGQVGYDPATGGGVWTAGRMSDEEIRAFYRSSNPTDGGGESFISMSGKPASAFTLEGLYGSPMPSTTASKMPTSSKSSSTSRATNNLTQSIRAMGEQGLTKSELSSIMGSTGKSGADVIKRLDKINQNLATKDKVGINLNSGAANKLIKKARRDPFAVSTMFNPSSFGTGKISSALQEMMGKRATGGYINPISGKQSATPGEEPKFMMGGTAIRPGGRQTVRGFGKQYEFKGGTKGGAKGPYDGMSISQENGGPGPWAPTSSSTTVTEEPTVMANEPVMPEEEVKQPSTLGLGGFGADLSNWATGFKTKRSSRARAGRSAQGLASQRVNPTGAFRGGM